MEVCDAIRGNSMSLIGRHWMVVFGGAAADDVRSGAASRSLLE